MEAKTQFIQQKTLVLEFTNGIANASVDIPFAVNKIIIRQIAGNHNNALMRYIKSDLIRWSALGIVNLHEILMPVALHNEFYFDTPTKINGYYNFTLYELNGGQDVLYSDEAVVILEFYRVE